MTSNVVLRAVSVAGHIACSPLFWAGVVAAFAPLKLTMTISSGTCNEINDNGLEIEIVPPRILPALGILTMSFVIIKHVL